MSPRSVSIQHTENTGLTSFVTLGASALLMETKLAGCTLIAHVGFSWLVTRVEFCESRDNDSCIIRQATVRPPFLAVRTQ